VSRLDSDMPGLWFIARHSFGLWFYGILPQDDMFNQNTSTFAGYILEQCLHSVDDIVFHLITQGNKPSQNYIFHHLLTFKSYCFIKKNRNDVGESK